VSRITCVEDRYLSSKITHNKGDFRGIPWENTNNKIIEYNGEKNTVTNWCRQFNITQSLFDNRIRLGWSLDKIFTTPKRKLCRKSS
jgi:hypothetical protein